MDFGEMAKDEFNTDDEKNILLQLDSYERQAHAGAIFEDLRRHPAWQKVEDYMKNEMEGANRTVFNDPDGDHRKAIFQIQGMIKLRNWIYAQCLAGQIASRAIAAHFKAVSDEKKALGLE